MIQNKEELVRIARLGREKSRDSIPLGSDNSGKIEKIVR
jgi:hypothetical protein